MTGDVDELSAGPMSVAPRHGRRTMPKPSTSDQHRPSLPRSAGLGV